MPSGQNCPAETFEEDDVTCGFFGLCRVRTVPLPGVQRKARSSARSGCVKDGFSRCVDLAKLQQLIQDVQNGFPDFIQVHLGTPF
ncbi:unnamed protein product [Coregonus sp. 'balchen']|nr:unnamed protein product [Coregonus sp. 'balchen']